MVLNHTEFIHFSQTKILKLRKKMFKILRIFNNKQKKEKFEKKQYIKMYGGL